VLCLFAAQHWSTFAAFHGSPCRRAIGIRSR
jgi:hypothetical protein